MAGVADSQMNTICHSDMKVASFKKTLQRRKANAEKKEADLRVRQTVDDWRDWNTDDNGKWLSFLGIKWDNYYVRWLVLFQGNYLGSVRAGGPDLNEYQRHVFTLCRVIDEDGALLKLKGNIRIVEVARCFTQPFVLKSEALALKAVQYIVEHDVI